MSKGGVKRICQYCGKEFWTYKAWLRNGKAGKYCSIECQRKGRPKKKPIRVKKICVICGKEFWVKRYRESTAKCCSRKCQRIYLHNLLKKKVSKRKDWDNSNQRKTWAKRVLERDNYTCQICGSKENLEAHHIIPIAYDISGVADLDNGITLCRVCHHKIHLNYV